MSKKITLNIDQELYKHLEHQFKDNEQGLNQFIIDAVKSRLKSASSDTLTDKKDDLESYLQKGSSGSRTYGVKGQGW